MDQENQRFFDFLHLQMLLLKTLKLLESKK